MSTALKDIELLLLDVDGVLTDGSITYTDSGEQIKSFNAKDGLGMRLLMDAGIQVGIITARKSGALAHRCENLGITLVLEGIKNKAAALQEICRQIGVPADKTAYIGDDLIDLPAMKRAGFAVCVADGCDVLKPHSDMVTVHAGGKGAVREVCEAILKSKNLWDNVVDGFLQ